MVYLGFIRKSMLGDHLHYITMTTFSPTSSPRAERAKINKSISPHYDPYPKLNDVEYIAADLELEYINERFCIKYESKYFRLNKIDGTIMLSKTKPLYFIELNHNFITTIKKKKYKLCGDYPHIRLCEMDNDAYNDEIHRVAINSNM
jgi:hypothetical protein